jgi:eukaryotic-like serine/threonine-protein kinase
MIGETIAHYEILEKLGEGGMGVVYKALDTRLQRLVALKFLPPEIVSSPGRIERFQAEARAVSSLNHPHIATIHAMDEDAGRRFLVLEYLAGGTLRSRIQMYSDRGEEFPVEETVRIMAAVADGLAHAHRNGVVHRDLKPENIMFTDDGVPRITDFGLAKSPHGSEITTEGVTVGTVPYIAPEQAVRGETSPRGDLFAIGVVMYEMLSGARPFSGATDFATLQAIVNDNPARLRHVRPDVPPALDRMVQKLLEKEPDRRFQSAADLTSELYALAGYESPSRAITRDDNITRTLTRFALPTGRLAIRRRRRPRWIPAAIAAAVLLAGAAGWYAWKARSSPSGVAQLAVLPFHTDSRSAEDKNFARGMAEKLAGALAATAPNLSVTPTAEIARRNIATPPDAWHALGIRHVLIGKVQPAAAEQMRVDLQLVDASRPKVLASQSVISSGPDLDVAVQRAATSMIALIRPPNRENPTADEHYFQGQTYLQRYDKPGNIDHAIAEFDKAIQLDPGHAFAFAGLASAWWRAWQYSRGDKDAIDRAHQNAMLALARNKDLAMPHIVLGAIAVQARQVSDGIEELKKAIKIEPVSADAWRELASAYVASGNIKEAETSYQQAIRYSPDSWMGYNDLGVFYNKEERYAEAEQSLDKAAALAPDNYIVYRNLGGVEMATGKWAAAELHFRRAIELRPSGSVYSNLGTLYLYMGRYTDAIPVLERAARSARSDRNGFAIWSNLGDAYKFGGGSPAKALAAWRKAINIGLERLRTGPDDATEEAEIAVYEAKAGDLASARSRIRSALARTPRDGAILFYGAIVAELDHKPKEALAQLRSALANGYSQNLVEQEPELAALRKNSAYSALVAHLKEGK